MKDIVYSNKALKELKKLLKRNINKDNLMYVIELIANDKELPARCNPHKLSGNYSGLWECHLEPDLLVIYEYVGNELVIIRLGSHADLF